jgi:hypothetical protein
MARQLVNRQPRWDDIPTLAFGLRSDVDYLNASPRAVQLAQNARCRTGRLKKRNGSRYYSPAIGTGRNARIIGLHQWVPETRTNENFVYAASASHIYRMPWDSTSVDPPTSLVDMTFPAGYSWVINAIAAHFTDYNDYCFSHNGRDYSMQMRKDAPNDMYVFGIDKMEPPTVTTSAAGGLITAGVHGYHVRAVRELTLSPRVREYAGARSDVTSVTTAGATSTNTISWVATTDGQVTGYEIYRTLPDKETPYFLARVAVGTTTYVDTAAAPSEDIDEDCLQRIKGIRYSTTDASGVLFVVGDDKSGCNWYNSRPNRPQEFGIYSNGVVTRGSGDVTGCAEFNGNIFVFREKGIAVFTQDSNKDYYESGFISGYGCVAPWSVRLVKEGSANFVTFLDGTEGPCLITVNGIRSIKRTKHSDACKWFDGNYIDLDHRRYVAVGYKDGYTYWGITPEGQQYNTQCMIFDHTTDSWFGPDTGYSAGPMCTRINGRGVFGSGELLAAVDGDSVRVQELDAPYSRDVTGAAIVLNVKGMAVGARMFPHEREFQQIAFMARLAGIVQIKVYVPSNNYEGTLYMFPTMKYYWDDGSLFDSGKVYDQAVQSLLDAMFYDGGDLMDTMKDLPYEIELDSCSAQGAYMVWDIYDPDSPAQEIIGIKILSCDRGAR